MKSIITITFALVIACGTAQADVPAPILPVNGAQFFNRCTNPNPEHGPEIVGICAAYVAGIADGLSDAGQVCIRPGMTPQRLLPIALGWMNSRSQNGGFPAAVQIKTGLTVLFPCHRTRSRATPEAMNSEQMMEKATKFLAFLNAIKPILSAVF